MPCLARANYLCVLFCKCISLLSVLSWTPFRDIFRFSARHSDVDDGNFVKSMALKDMDLKARPNAKKSTLIIHSSKKVQTCPCTAAVAMLCLVSAMRCAYVWSLWF